MVRKSTKIDIPESIKKNWQEITDILASLLGIPAALIMRLTDPDIEVFISNAGKDNPYHPGDREKVKGSGLYCEAVMSTHQHDWICQSFCDAAIQ